MKSITLENALGKITITWDHDNAKDTVHGETSIPSPEPNSHGDIFTTNNLGPDPLSWGTRF